ncbi:hypothetical protein A0H81_02854 [Grifola frondosa]|uniref:Uncharacterized protein n=1 Tax=Grifola frondosa TaxID=5627 RepID=A0A1C7MNH2_GRIFR|nr:hypothetical protein A0H81_02854 [Grifola frondosa]
MIHAVRTYPASAGMAMLPLSPENNWAVNVLFCGGANIQVNQWGTDWDIAQYNTLNSCVTIMLDVSGSYVEDNLQDPLFERCERR